MDFCGYGNLRKVDVHIKWAPAFVWGILIRFVNGLILLYMLHIQKKQSCVFVSTSKINVQSCYNDLNLYRLCSIKLKIALLPLFSIESVNSAYRTFLYN